MVVPKGKSIICSWSPLQEKDRRSMIEDYLRAESFEIAENPFDQCKKGEWHKATVYHQIACGIPVSLLFAENPLQAHLQVSRVKGAVPCVVDESGVASFLEGGYNCFIIGLYDSAKAYENLIRMLSSCSYRKEDRLERMVAQEWCKQQWSLNCIASESLVSEDICQLQGSVLTNKYAEGYPKARYYAGCKVVDEIEVLAQKRAQSLFECAYANVQPHSGSQANQAVFQGLMSPGDVLLGMGLAHGGHLTHGFSVNSSGQIYKGVSYSVCSDTYEINYEEVRAKALEHKPKVIIAGASAYSRLIDYALYRAIADEVGAYLLVDMAHIAGLVAAKILPSPLPYADVVTSTTHKTLKGPRGGLILCNDPAIYKKINRGVFPGVQGGPLLHVIAAKAQCFQEASAATFRRLMRTVVEGAQCLADVLSQAGLQVLTGGTDNHQILVDLRNQGISGQEAEDRLSRFNIFINKNMVPFDTAKPMNPSGMRIGAMALACRGFKKQDFLELGALMVSVLRADKKKDEIERRVRALCQKYPIL